MDSAPPNGPAFARLLDELTLGVVELTSAGAPQWQNVSAGALLDGPLGDAIRELLAQAVQKGTSAEALEASRAFDAGEIRILVAQSPREGEGYVAVLERKQDRSKAEAAALRGLLSNVVAALPLDQVLSRTLSTACASVRDSQLVLFEIDRPGRELRALASAAQRGRPTLELSARPLGPAFGPGRTALSGHPTFLRALEESYFEPHVRGATPPGLCGLCLPVSFRGEVKAVLFAVAPALALHEGAVRLLQGLADALGTVLEHGRREAALEAERQATAELLANLPDAVVEQGPEGRIRRVGGRAGVLLGEEVIGRTLESLVAENQRESLRALVQRAQGARSDGPAQGDFDVPGQDGTPRPCEVSVICTKAPTGEVVRAIFRDHTARRALEAKLLRAREVAAQHDRLATIGRLAAGVAHEINNPLAFLKSNLNSLGNLAKDLKERPEELSANLPEVEAIVAESLEGVQRIARIVEALKGTARARTENVRFDVGRAVNEAVTVFRGAKKHECTIDCTLPQLPEVTGSPGGVGQIILNLLQNGLDAMGGKGALTITAEALEGGRAIELRVSDLGPGIPIDVQARMFEPFFTTKDIGKGTGLGLHICRTLAEEMKGTLAFDTGPKGTTFRLRLPSAA